VSVASDMLYLVVYISGLESTSPMHCSFDIDVMKGTCIIMEFLLFSIDLIQPSFVFVLFHEIAGVVIAASSDWL
jgi:hypothetical protein